jgi:hypothetical protein
MKKPYFVDIGCKPVRKFNQIIVPPKAIMPILFFYNQCTTSRKNRMGTIAFGDRMMCIRVVGYGKTLF